MKATPHKPTEFVAQRDADAMREFAAQLNADTVKEQQLHIADLEARLRTLEATFKRRNAAYDLLVEDNHKLRSDFLKAKTQAVTLEQHLRDAHAEIEAVDSRVREAFRLAYEAEYVTHTSDELNVWVILPRPRPGIKLSTGVTVGGDDRVERSLRVYGDDDPIGGTHVIGLWDLLQIWRTHDHLGDDGRLGQALAHFLAEVAEHGAKLTWPCGHVPDECAFCFDCHHCVEHGEACVRCAESDPEEATAMWVDRMKGK